MSAAAQKQHSAATQLSTYDRHFTPFNHHISNTTLHQPQFLTFLRLQSTPTLDRLL
jgi:hypothetical protein